MQSIWYFLHLPSFVLLYFFLALCISPPLLVFICIAFFLILFPSLLPQIFLCPVFQSLLGAHCPLTPQHSESPTELFSPLLLATITFVKHLRELEHRLEPLLRFRQIHIAYSNKISWEAFCLEIQKDEKEEEEKHNQNPQPHLCSLPWSLLIYEESFLLAVWRRPQEAEVSFQPALLSHVGVPIVPFQFPAIPDSRMPFLLLLLPSARNILEDPGGEGDMVMWKSLSQLNFLEIIFFFHVSFGRLCSTTWCMRFNWWCVQPYLTNGEGIFLLLNVMT